MIWLSPWALLGLFGIALPALIHLLGRGHAQRRRFPSLRFLEPSRLLPTQRTRIHDPWLLVVRAAIVALAAVALARPLWLSTNRKRALDRGVALVAIVDTGWSMQRMSANGRRAVDLARDSARARIKSAQAGLVVESARPRTALAGAVTWLAREGRHSEIAIYSAFPAGTIDSIDLIAVPKAIGLTMNPVAVTNADTVVQVFANGSVITARVSHDSGATTTQWTSNGRAPSVPLRVLASPSDSAFVEALKAAMRTVAIAVPVDSSRVVAVIFPGAPELTRLRAEASPVHTPWMVDRLARMPADLQTTPSAEGELDGHPALLFLPTIPIRSPESARLVAAIARGWSSPPGEGCGVDPLAPATLVRWNRPASTTEADRNYRPDDGRSDSRWVWGAVIVLLGIEQWMRRTRRTTANAESEAPARAA